MRTIKLNIDEIVSRNLNMTREKRLQEAFIPLNEIKDKNQFLKKYLIVTSNLLEQGYTLEEIENPLNNLNVDWGGMFKESLWSEAKEYAIKWLLEAFGMKEDIAKQVAIGLSDMNPLDLIRVFKNSQSCLTHMPHISDALLEVLVRYYGGKWTNTGAGNAATSLVGNIVGEAIRKSNVSENISNITCKLIHG